MSIGTSQMCTCCQARPSTLCKTNPLDSTLSIRSKAHGTFHQRDFTLASLVDMLDPTGTSFVPAVAGSAV